VIPHLAPHFHRIVVVDNNSSDHTVTLAKRIRNAVVIENRTNVGFAAAVNSGFRRTLGDVVAIANPDVKVLDPADLARLLKNFERADVGLVAPRLRLPSGKIQDSARQIPTPVALALRRFGRRRSGAVHPNITAEVPWVVAAFMLVRREAFESIGGFDTRFRLYMEDVDFCVRLSEAGWRVVYEPDCTLGHVHRGDSRRSILGRPFWSHIVSAARFFLKHPSYLFPAFFTRKTGRPPE